MALPKTVQIKWDANPAADAVTGYTVAVNGAVIGTTPETSLNYDIPAPGTYVAMVIAANEWGSGEAGSATLVVGVPKQVANVSFVVL